MDKYNLNRFVVAQKENYNIALEELRDGFKTTHWIWYIFPQLKGIGHSAMSEYYGISDINEAKAYLKNKLLRKRLIQCCVALLSQDEDDITYIMGEIDDLKLQSSMTLFELAEPKNRIFTDVLNRFYGGKRDLYTVSLVRKQRKKQNDN